MQPLIKRFSNFLKKNKKKTIFISIIVFVVIFLGGVVFVLVSVYRLPVPKEKKIIQIIPKDAVFAPDHMIVKYQEGYSPEDLQKAVEQAKNASGVGATLEKNIEKISGQKTAAQELAELEKKLQTAGVISQQKLYDTQSPELKNYYLLELKPGSDVRKVHTILDSFDELTVSSPDYIYTTQDAPNDPLYTSYQWNLQKVDMEKAWSVTQGSSGVTVAVVDTGIDMNNPDTSKNVILGPNYINGSNSPIDDFGHGTHVSGIIGAASNNGVGITGADWNDPLLEVKSMGLDKKGQGTGTLSQISQGIQYAIDHGARVVNMSLSSETTSPPCNSLPYQSLFNYAAQKGVVVVVAAGNVKSDVSNYAPANCQNAIIVGATDQQNQRASFSNFGSNVTIAAPGVNIVSTKATCTTNMCNGSGVVDSNYIAASGTSMAAPLVSGVVALLLSQYPHLSFRGVKQCLLNNATAISTDRPIGPLLNAGKALTNCHDESPTPTQDTNSNSQISGKLFIDSNGNGTVDPGEKPLEGIEIDLKGPFNKVLYSDDNGDYNFGDLPKGQYSLVFKKNGEIIGETNKSLTMPAKTNYNLPLPPSFESYVPPPTDGLFSLFGTVAMDTNGNGKLDDTDTRISGAQVSISGPTGANPITDSQGNFLLSNLPSGQYTVTVTVNGQILHQYDTTTALSSYLSADTSATGQKGTRVDFLLTSSAASAPTPDTNSNNNSQDNPTLYYQNPGDTTPVPLIFYSCHQANSTKSVNGKTITLSYLTCTAK